MNKIRQFSFQDYIVSKHSELTLDSISTLSSCCNRNLQHQETEASQGTGTNLYTQTTLSNSNLASENLFTFKDQEEEGNRVRIDHTRGRNLPDNKRNRNAMSENNYPGGRKPQDQKNLFGFGQENYDLEEQWKRTDKINKMLEEHRKKKLAKNIFAPLRQLDQNIPLNEIDQNICQLTSERTNTAQFVQASDRIYELPQENILTSRESDRFDFFEGSNSDKNTELRQDQLFSNLDDSLRNNVFSSDIPHEKQFLNFTQSITNGKQTPELGGGIRRSESIKRFEEHRKIIENNIMPKENMDLESNERKKSLDKKLPIEERLRLKNVEREMRLTQLREQKARKEMSELRSKPKISENSTRIAISSKRAIENEEILEKLSASDTTRSKFLNNSSYGLNTSQNQVFLGSKHERSFGAESNHESGQNLYKRSRRQPSLTITGSHKVNFEGYRPSPDIEGKSQIEILQDFESNQTNTIAKEEESLEGTLPLRSCSSESNLQREAAERLRQARLKKLSSQKPEEGLMTDGSVVSPQVRVQPVIMVEKKREINNTGSTKSTHFTKSDVDTAHSLNTEQVSFGIITSPKQVYLKMSNRMIEEKENDMPYSNYESQSSHSRRGLTMDSLRRETDQKTDRSGTDEMNRELEAETKRLQDINNNLQNNYNTVDSKKGARQLTFGNYSTRRLSISSPKVGLESENKNRENTAARHEIKIHNENTDRETPKSSDRNNYESLLNSWRLRQQKTSKSGEYSVGRMTKTKNTQSSQALHIRDLNQTPKVNLGENKPWGDLDVYLRNTMWLSAKNSKMANLNQAKEQKELRECTFRPNVGDRVANVAIISPREEYKFASEMMSKGRLSESGKNRKHTQSYKDLHSQKGRSYDQNQMLEIKSPSSCAVPLVFGKRENKQNIQIEFGEENGQKFYLA